MSDTFARVLAGLAVLAVAVIAGIVSYSHIDALALAHGYTPDTARLLPLSVDGLIVASSLVLLVEARAQRPAPVLARAGLWIAIGATLAANIMHGVAFGPVGAITNAWPGAAFVLASEILLSQMRRARTTPAPDEVSETVSADVPGTVLAAVPAGVPEFEPLTVLPSTPSPVPVPVPASTPSSTVPPVPDDSGRTVAERAPGRARQRASGRRASTPEKVFAAEIQRGELPSLRAVKTKMSCGNDKARAILADLQGIVAGQAVADV